MRRENGIQVGRERRRCGLEQKGRTNMTLVKVGNHYINPDLVVAVCTLMLPTRPREGEAQKPCTRVFAGSDGLYFDIEEETAERVACLLCGINFAATGKGTDHE